MSTNDKIFGNSVRRAMLAHILDASVSLFSTTWDHNVNEVSALPCSNTIIEASDESFSMVPKCASSWSPEKEVSLGLAKQRILTILEKDQA